MPKKLKAILALADGKIFKGLAFGAERSVENAVIGEVVFNTSMYGYQEILSDPSYAGQIMTFTTAYIGNVGCNSEDLESNKIYTEAVICKNISMHPSNFRSQQSLDDYLRKANVPGLAGIDTRLLVQHLRDAGAQMGAIACGENINIDDLVDKAKSAGSMLGKNLVKEVTCKSLYTWEEGVWSLKNSYSKPNRLNAPHCVVIDCGVKHNILRLLVESGFKVTVVPASTDSDSIKALGPDALFLSNGPGDPATLDQTVNSVKTFIGKLPIFGICLGHQILGQALGAKTYKLKFGHRGGNHPVKDLKTGKVEITVQNHGFAVDAESLNSLAKVSHINLNDGTVEGLEFPEQKLFSVQYHPEASPGPHDSKYLFDRFYSLLEK